MRKILPNFTDKYPDMKVLVVEDEKRVAEMIRKGLSEEGYHVVLAYDGETGKKLALTANPDVAIIDIVLPKINGLDLCKELRLTHPGLPILMLTAMGTTDDKLEGFEAGADDYLVKPFDFRELVARIRVVARRGGAAGPHSSGFVLKIADLEMNLHTRIVKRAGTTITLTKKEFSLLEFMLQNPERVLSRAEIAERVWHTHDWGTNFIDVYVNYLRNKIDKNFTPKLIHTRSGVGFILTTGEN